MDVLIDAEELAELKFHAQCWNDLVNARTAAKRAPDDSGWKRAAVEEGPVAGILMCRAEYGISLREAKHCVEDFLRDRR